MSVGKAICVFSLSKADMSFKFTVGINGAIKWLEGKRQAPHRYYFCVSKPKKGLAPGAIMLFSFEGQIFGQATVSKGIQSMSSQGQPGTAAKSAGYKYYVTMDPSSIEVFRFHPTKEEISEQMDLRFAQLFTYIDSDQYLQIIKMAKR